MGLSFDSVPTGCASGSRWGPKHTGANHLFLSQFSDLKKEIKKLLLKSTTKKSFTMNGPLRSVGIRGGAHGVKVAINGRDVVSVANAQPSASSAATANAGATAADDDLSIIRLGRFIAEQQPTEQQPTEQPAQQPVDNGNDDPTPTPTPSRPVPPLPTPGGPSPIPHPRPARLGL